jgi:tetratricopeptide (TPR) repeat protein
MNTNQNIADDLLGQKDYQKALQIYLEILRQHPNDGRAYQGIAQCYYKLKKYDDAFSAANQAIRTDPNLAISHVVLAYIYHHRGDFEKALAEAQVAYNLSPQLDEIGNCYGALLLGSGKLDESIAVLTRAIEAHPQSVLAHQNLGLAYREKRDHKRFVEEMRLVFKYRPTFISAKDLLIAYQHRYAVFLSLIVPAALFGALVIKSRILLIIPALIVIQGLLADLQFVIERRWRRKGRWRVLLFSLVTDCALGAITYAIYLTLNPK